MELQLSKGFRADLGARRGVLQFVPKGVFHPNQHQGAQNMFRIRRWAKHVFRNVTVLDEFDRVGNACPSQIGLQGFGKRTRGETGSDLEYASLYLRGLRRSNGVNHSDYRDIAIRMPGEESARAALARL
jgi:hypothetical protein